MDIAPGKLHISNTQELVRVSGHYSHTLAASVSRHEDKFDLAIVPLSDDVTARLRDLRFLDISDLAPDHVPTYQTPFASRYLVLGYPASKARVRSDGSFDIEYLLYIGEQQHPVGIARHGCTAVFHLIIDNDKKRSNNVGGRVTAPDPYGISGGVVFYLGEGLRINSGAEKLVGIAVEYAGTARKAMAATRIGVILDGLQLRHPESVARIARP